MSEVDGNMSEVDGNMSEVCWMDIVTSRLEHSLKRKKVKRL
jgi:hypothetical protein